MIDSDYLWLHEQRYAGPRLRRIALILLIPLLGGAAWLTAAPTTLLGERDDPAPLDGRAKMDTPAASAAGENAASGLRFMPPDAAFNELFVAGIPGSRRSAAAVAGAGKQPALTLQTSGLGLQALIASATASDKPREGRYLADGGRGLATAQSATRWHTVRVRPGDTLSIAFNRNGLSYSDSLKIAHLSQYGRRFTAGLRSGDTMRVRADAKGAVLAVDYPVDALHTLRVRAAHDGSFEGDMIEADVEHRKAYASGVIDTSFYADALAAGLSDAQVMTLVKIFGWDVDFAFDIRPGDRFVVVYDELFRDGAKVGDGEILAAAFTNQGRTVRALRYTGVPGADGDYYSPDGRAMKKAFIRTPVDYTRISSRFNLSRKHPILNRIRRHEGTDYAAPSGTPIRATGNGRIAFRGRRGGYGNMIVIRHSSHLSTRYGHMSSFAKGFHTGSRVQQGDVIGYVGMTGLATGPHLHYEFRVDGTPKDPEKVALPKAMPLPKKYLPDFKQRTAPLLAQLDTLSHTTIARASEGPLSD